MSERTNSPTTPVESRTGKGAEEARTVTLPVTEGDDVTFTGRVVAESIGTDPEGLTGGRAFDVLVYVDQKAGYVAHVRGRLTKDGHRDWNYVAHAESHAELDDALSLVSADVFVFMEDEAFDELRDPQRKPIVVTLSKRFDKQIADVLAQVTRWETSSGSQT